MKALLNYAAEIIVALAFMAGVVWLVYQCLPAKRLCCDGISVRCCCEKNLCRCWVNGKFCSDACEAEGKRRGFLK